jgi:peptide/nickel transport system substrate-binding protein
VVAHLNSLEKHLLRRKRKMASKKISRRDFLRLSALTAAGAALAGCCPTPTPETVEKEVVVTKIVTEKGEEKIITVVPTAEVEETVTYERNETLYVSGSAWGPASTWNPFQPGSLANTTGTLGLVYETLFAFDPLSGKLTPWLAESGKWSDDTTYDLTLRKGLTWSDGEALTADDVVFTFELGQKYAALWFSPMLTGSKKYLDSVVAIDDTHVQFLFTDPLYQEFANNLYNIPIVPMHLWADRSEEDITVGANENPIGSGAYLYDTHAEDRNIWVRNEDWWGASVFGAPAPKRIVDIRFSSNNVALGAVIKGEIDLSNNFLPGIATLAQKGYVQTYFAEAPYMLSANTAVLFLNTTIAPMDDAAFRKALAFAINVDDIVNVAYANLVKAASPTGLLPTLSKYDDADVLARLGYTYDPAKTAQILEGAGYTKGDDGFYKTPDGAAIELEVTCPFGWTDWMEAINVIATSAQAAGINIKAVTPDYGAWNTALQSGTFNMTLNNWAAMSNTPWTLYNLLFNHPIKEQMQSGNFGRWENQEMFDLVDGLAKVQVGDEEGMRAGCAAIQELMLTEMPMIPLWYNGLWAQFSNAVWTNWPTEDSGSSALPSTWSGYWQLGGLQTLLELELVPTE